MKEATGASQAEELGCMFFLLILIAVAAVSVTLAVLI